MTEFHDRDLAGADLKNVNVTGATLRSVSLSDAQIRSSDLQRVRMRGVELIDVNISGALENVVVNGVDIGPLIEAELDRRMPDRAKMRPDTADGFREAYAILERLWGETVERARKLPEADLHREVDDEFSFIQTIRHLNFASAAWAGRMILGNPSPWHPLDIPWDDAPGWPGIPWDRGARPTLDEVLAVRGDRQAMVRGVLATLTDEDLATDVSQTEPGWPKIEKFPYKECLRIILNEEWEHRLYAERDLNLLEKEN